MTVVLILTTAVDAAFFSTKPSTTIAAEVADTSGTDTFSPFEISELLIAIAEAIEEERFSEPLKDPGTGLPTPLMESSTPEFATMDADNGLTKLPSPGCASSMTIESESGISMTSATLLTIIAPATGCTTSAVAPSEEGVGACVNPLPDQACLGRSSLSPCAKEQLIP